MATPSLSSRLEINRKDQAFWYRLPRERPSLRQKARRFTADRVAGRNVTVSVLDTDRYGRAVGAVTTDDGTILNRELLTNGYAGSTRAIPRFLFAANGRRRRCGLGRRRLALVR